MESSRGPPRVKNKSAAPVQISAEQLLREAVDRQEVALQAPTQRFVDLEELHEYQGRKRREFEDYVRRNRVKLSNWLRYAQWELEQKEFARARSVFERALDVHPNSIAVWIRYCEAEMKSRNINHARNLLDRAVTRLPRCDKLWYKYVYMEETLANLPATRQVFDRWMHWRPDDAAWSAYIKLEKRYGEIERARNIFAAFTVVHPEPRTWLKWAKFEEEHGTSSQVRDVFGRAVEALGEGPRMDERVFMAYARFEVRLKEYERARAIYRFALDRLPRSRSATLHEAYTRFEKQFGDRDGIEDVVLAKRRVHYEDLVRQSPKNYDNWFDYARLEEAAGDSDRVRDVYERAIAQMPPPTQEKRHWRRYIYLWLFYAAWEELDGDGSGNPERARQVYRTCLELVPHQHFTFAKLWLQAAYAEVRQGQLPAARKLLGRAIGMCPKDKLFRAYIELERRLFEFGRCRTLHQKWIEWSPANCQAWIKLTELERGLDDLERARAIFELAVAQPALDMPELLWKEYIDFEEGEGDFDRVRALYERLLAKTDHVKVWISYAHFEISVPADDDDDEGDEAAEADAKHARLSEGALARARAIFERANRALADKDVREERASLLAAWVSLEQAHGAEADVQRVEAMQPRRTRRRRRIEGAAAGEDTYEEFVDYVFPADDAQARGLSNMLALAQKWKQTGGALAT